MSRRSAVRDTGSIQTPTRPTLSMVPSPIPPLSMQQHPQLQLQDLYGPIPTMQAAPTLPNIGTWAIGQQAATTPGPHLYIGPPSYGSYHSGSPLRRQSFQGRDASISPFGGSLASHPGSIDSRSVSSQGSVVGSLYFLCSTCAIPRAIRYHSVNHPDEFFCTFCEQGFGSNDIDQQWKWCILGSHDIQRQRFFGPSGVELADGCLACCYRLGVSPESSARASPIPGGSPTFRRVTTVDSSYRTSVTLGRTPSSMNIEDSSQPD